MLINGMIINESAKTMKIYADFPSESIWEFKSVLQIYCAQEIIKGLNGHITLSDLSILFSKLKRTKMVEMRDAYEFAVDYLFEF